MKKNISPNRSFKENLLSFATLVVLLLFFSFGSYFVNVFAFPPDGNLEAPINTGTSTQTKTGVLHLNNYLGANGEPVLWGRAPITNETLVYFAVGNKLRVRQTGSGANILTVAPGVVGINQDSPNAEADLDIGSKGIRLSGLTRNVWPKWGRQSGFVAGTDNVSGYSCPTGFVITSLGLKHGSGDKEYLASVTCTEIKDLYTPPAEEVPPPPRICYTTEDPVTGELREVCK
jgi:hypothetical protein